MWAVLLHTVSVLSIDQSDGIEADQVIDLDLGFSPSPAGSGEMLLHTDGPDAILALLVVDRQFQPVGPAIVTFVRCSQSVFGYPNDEAAMGDPRLQDRGYGFYEVRDSPWTQRLRAYNRQAFPKETWSPSGTRHFLVSCHESTAQFLADEIRIEPRPGPFAAAVREACERLVD
ncbi:hypothetical protein GCM10027614_32980 [Micromonospora vulcania]